jgi:nicotinamide riboside kinase
VRRIDRRRFDSMVICTTWTLWKQRNARAFGNTRRQKNVDQMLQEIRDEFQL